MSENIKREYIEDVPEEEEFNEDQFIYPRFLVKDYGELMDALYDHEIQYTFWKNAYERREVELWLETDWAEVFDGKKPTVKDKEMWIKQELMELKELRDTTRIRFESFKKLYEMVLKYGFEVLG